MFSVRADTSGSVAAAGGVPIEVPSDVPGVPDVPDVPDVPVAHPAHQAHHVEFQLARHQQQRWNLMCLRIQKTKIVIHK